MKCVVMVNFYNR